MNKFEKFTADVHNAFELLGGKKSYNSFVALISASARRDEQERIIKLLEDTYCPLPEEWHLENLQTCFGYCGNSQDYIALIKGQN